ncbi:MAG: UDP-N-acetylenolpyruvoylglucosamine reductase [Candidatus Portnoybacteria bacterium CG11_big_fil_rev_8_21_14_0_20_40_15]|uniref:UDP-N-acetylenolpyruvoylglucosamine reductase n=2 Tax=Candidatus Portnoyibacteriota TaxID=1817913 RepID=A0A2M7YNR7_9BACT|nr:MAG: UDP-N-acetylenolpyruvoylglucosamine reductase [Candidatus Portnoybacteria bacterium CG11_big_fil_rev_8_21_14_0_20_40_15]PJA64600.1 MAG: UDP-N-acetylenolpyruvoylglucosamine reductase [Candidatus Portnoybacteria bacterium CG_4_9_14_3_um_filter_40_10]
MIINKKMAISGELNIQENVILANYTTFRIGGPAKYFVEVNSVQEIKDAILWARRRSPGASYGGQAKQNPSAGGLRYFILGGGSNLLVSDEGFKGLIIKMQNANIKMQSDNVKCKITAEAGAPFVKIILETTKAGYSGAEWGFGIPGTIGGAICGNAHRLGQSIAPIVESVEILDSSLENKILQNNECGFDYGKSRFKKTGEIILSANLIFKKQEQKIIDEVLEQAKAVIRRHPPFPSAGCAFKNYELKDKEDALLKNHPELKSRVRKGKIGVGFLIDQCGLKGKQIGGAKIWEGHANYIVNVGGAKASDIIELINLCKKSVKEKFGIKLEEEIRYLGF